MTPDTDRHHSPEPTPNPAAEVDLSTAGTAAGLQPGASGVSGSRRPAVVIGLLGVTLDAGSGPRRWDRWRPTVALCQQHDFIVDRLELIHDRSATTLAAKVRSDIAIVSPETTVTTHSVALHDPWDLEEVYALLHDFAAAYTFDPDREDYYVHITTGTHVAQICVFLLTEARYFPARLIQTAPPRRETSDEVGSLEVIDLDLSRYDRLASRFEREHSEAIASLKGGIVTRNQAFNRLVDRIEHVAARTTDPLLITGPTGAGKTRLARRIYEVRRQRRLVAGDLIEVNCATLRGDAAMSTLFGHRRGAFTGAVADRQGLLRSADGGMLFLDEIGELGLDEQAMLLRALEARRFLPLGSDVEVMSDFQLIAGTNRDLPARVRQGRFREDLFARINLWMFELPRLRDRPEDIEPNVDYELERIARDRGRMVRFNREARARFLAFAMAPTSAWSGNFRDLHAALTRMATLAPGGRISTEIVEEEIERLRIAWTRLEQDDAPAGRPARAPSATIAGPIGEGAYSETVSDGEGAVMSGPQWESPRSGTPVTEKIEQVRMPDEDPQQRRGSNVKVEARERAASDREVLTSVLNPERLAALDEFDLVQLAYVVRICQTCRTLSEAGRRLFGISRSRRTSTNDADRLRKYLARFDLDWAAVTKGAG